MPPCVPLPAPAVTVALPWSACALAAHRGARSRRRPAPPTRPRGRSPSTRPRPQGTQGRLGPELRHHDREGGGAERLRAAVRRSRGRAATTAAPPRRASPRTRSRSRSTRPSPTSCSRRSSRTAGSDESLAKERDTTQQYVDYFSAHYELYGRKVKLVPVKASGAPDDDVAAKADAIKVATEVHAFASFGGPGQTTAYADELAAPRRALRRRLRDRRAAVVPRSARALRVADDRVARAGGEHWAAFVGKQLARRKAVHAGDAGPAHRRRARFGVVHYDDDRGHVRQERRSTSSSGWRRTR